MRHVILICLLLCATTAFAQEKDLKNKKAKSATEQSAIDEKEKMKAQTEDFLKELQGKTGITDAQKAKSEKADVPKVKDGNAPKAESGTFKPVASQVPSDKSWDLPYQIRTNASQEFFPMRAEPSVATDVLEYVPAGSLLTVTEKTSEVYRKVEYNGMVGYISIVFLASEKESE